MSKQRRDWSEKEYHRRLKEGRGQGTGSSYIPWILIQEIPSKGFVSRTLGHTTGRIHHLFSRLEADYFTILDYNPRVVDIRERFPLPLKTTLEISDKMGIAHPWPPNSDFPSVMTTDFLITLDDGKLLARTLKYASDLGNSRVIDKFKIELDYWNQKQIDWKIITEKEVNKNLATNLRWLHYGPPVEELVEASLLKDIESSFIHLYQNKHIRFCRIIDIIQIHYSLPPGTAIAIFKKLIRNGVIEINLRQRLDFFEGGGR